MINERIKQIRKFLNLTQEEFARRINVSRSTIATYENSPITPPSKSFLELVSDEYNINIDWLLNGNGEMINPPSETNDLITFLNDIEFESDDSFKRKFITMISHLDEDEWCLLAKMAEKLINERTINTNIAETNEQRLIKRTIMLPIWLDYQVNKYNYL